MKTYVCSVCGYVYDEAKGIPEAGIAPGTKWAALPNGWVCPLCGASVDQFTEKGAISPAEKKVSVMPVSGDDQELTALEMSALCSNLARGCEKQYMPEESALFAELAAYYKAASAPAPSPSFEHLLALIQQDLDSGLPAAEAAASGSKDRGALRALTWNGKVTRILQSLLARYIKEGEAMLEHTGVYVCTICGFIFVGDAPPALCPVCKVPNWKFEKVEGRATA